MTKETIKETTPDKNTIEVDKNQLNTLLEKVESLTKQNEMLFEIADEKKKALYYSRNKDKMPSEIGVRAISINGEKQIVMGWRTISNIVEQNPMTGVWKEDQTLELILQNGNKVEMPLVQFSRNYEKINCVKIGSEDTNGLVFVLKRLDNGEEIKISAVFAN